MKEIKLLAGKFKEINKAKFLSLACQVKQLNKAQNSGTKVNINNAM